MVGRVRLGLVGRYLAVLIVAVAAGQARAVYQYTLIDLGDCRPSDINNLGGNHGLGQ